MGEGKLGKLTRMRPMRGSLPLLFHSLVLHATKPHTSLQLSCARHSRGISPRERSTSLAFAALAFEPPAGEGKVDQAVEELREWVRQRGDEKILLLSGAGLSTASGIPDYR